MAFVDLYDEFLPGDVLFCERGARRRTPRRHRNLRGQGPRGFFPGRAGKAIAPLRPVVGGNIGRLVPGIGAAIAAVDAVDMLVPFGAPPSARYPTP